MIANNIELRFGQLAIKMGYISIRQLTDALAIQVLEEYQNNTHRLIGKILIDQGFLTLEEVDDILDKMKPSKFLSL